jgi:hypothetical protein
LSLPIRRARDQLNALYWLLAPLGTTKAQGGARKQQTKTQAAQASDCFILGAEEVLARFNKVLFTAFLNSPCWDTFKNASKKIEGK